MQLPTTTILNGTWQLLPVEEFAQGYYPLDTTAWLSQDLPAHWQQHPLLEYYAGKMVYRRTFDVAPIPTDAQSATADATLRYWLRLNGTFYWSQAFFNGIDLGRHEGYFAAYEREVTAWVARENTLIVEVECPDEHDKLGKRLITGVFSHWDALDPATNPGGIWLPVELIQTGPVRTQQVLLHTERHTDATAEIRFRTTLDAATAQDITLRWVITPHNFAGAIQAVEQQRSIAAGSQTISGVFEIHDPQLWWTHDMGHPNLYHITLEVHCAGQRSDSRSSSFGIRTFHMNEWIGYLNNVRFFIKGSNYPPGDTRIATMTRAAYDQDLRLAQECHMNMLRVHAHVEHPAFYEAADAAGILLWQDFPLQWLYKHEVLPEARRQATEMVHLLYSHPSVALWCMHNEPIYIADTKDESLSSRLKVYYSVFVFSWDRDVLDTQLKQVVEAEDSTRLTVRSSGEYAIPFWHEGTDSHFYYGWYVFYGRLHTWPKIVRQFPKNIRFVTEFGSQSLPNLESSLKFLDADITKIDWDYLVARHHLQATTLDHWLEWRSAESLEQLIKITQDYQIHVNRFYIDYLRLAKYRPTGGIVPFMFHDSNPAIQWSILDYWRVPKRSYTAMQLAFSPQYCFTFLDSEHYRVAVPLELPLYVVNDAHYRVPVQVQAILYDSDSCELARIERELNVPADCMAIEFERLRLTPINIGTYRLQIEWQPEHATLLRQEYEIMVKHSN
jgi:beta-mannosidase